MVVVYCGVCGNTGKLVDVSGKLVNCPACLDLRQEVEKSLTTEERCQHCNELMIVKEHNNTRYHVCLACVVSKTVVPHAPVEEDWGDTTPAPCPVEGDGTAPTTGPATAIAESGGQPLVVQLALTILEMASNRLGRLHSSQCEQARQVLRDHKIDLPWHLL